MYAQQILPQGYPSSYIHIDTVIFFETFTEVTSGCIEIMAIHIAIITIIPTIIDNGILNLCSTKD